MVYLNGDEVREAAVAIITHITSKCCKNAPANHATRYEDFERIGKGLYKVLGY